MNKKFTVLYKEDTFQCVLDSVGMVWIEQKDIFKSKSNNRQIKPARNINEAKEIAELMLHSMS